MSLVLSSPGSWTPRQTVDLEERYKESDLFCPAQFRDGRIDAAPPAQLGQAEELLDLSDLRPQPEGTTTLVPARERSSRSAAGQTAGRVAPEVATDHPLASFRPASSAGPPARRYELIYRNYAPTGPPAEIRGPPVPLPAHTVLLRVALFDKKMKRQEWIVHGKQTLLEVRPPGTSGAAQLVRSRPGPRAAAAERARLLDFEGAQVPGRTADEARRNRATRAVPKGDLDLAARLPPLRALAPGCRGPSGPTSAPAVPPHTLMPMTEPRLQRPSTSALFYIEGFYTSGDVGLSTTTRAEPYTARSRTCAPQSSPPCPSCAEPWTLRKKRRFERRSARVAASARRGAAAAAGNEGGHFRDALATSRSA